MSPIWKNLCMMPQTLVSAFFELSTMQYHMYDTTVRPADKETPFGYPSMSKKQDNNKERPIWDGGTGC